MENEVVKWYVNGQETPESKRLSYVSPWKTFSKLPDEEKERMFNAMRGELILAGRMENK